MLEIFVIMINKLSFFCLTLLFASSLNAQTFQWSKKTGSTGNDFALSIATDVSGNIYTTGAFTGTVDMDPGPGTLNYTSAGNSDVFITKQSPSGALIWSKVIGGSSLDQGNAIKLDASGNVYVGGTFATTVDFDPGAGVQSKTVAAASDAFILKLNASGDFVWVSVFAGTGNEQVKAIDIDASGNVLSTGFWYMTCDFDPGAGTYNILASATNSQNSAFISKLDNNGNFVWAGEIGAGQFHEGYAIDTDASENVYIGGYALGGTDYDPGAGNVNLPLGGGQEAFIVKLNSAGTFITAVKLNGAGHDMLNGLRIDQSGNVIATGFHNGTTDFDPGAGVANLTSVGLRDVFIIKLNASLGFIWARSFGSTSDDIGYGIMSDASDNIYAVGNFQGTVDFDPGAPIVNKTSSGSTDAYIVKLNSSGNLDFVKKIGGSQNEYGAAVMVNSAGTSIYTVGSFVSVCNFKTESGDYFMESSAASQDIFVHKLGDCVSPTAQTVTATQSTICTGGSTTINLSSSETGMSYYLKNNATNMIVAGPTTGTGGGISLNTGAINATTTYSVTASTAPFATNYALDLDGTNDYLDMGTNNRGVTNAITVSARVRTGLTGTSQFVVSKYLSASLGYYLIITATGQASFQGRDVAGGIKTSGNSTTMVADNQWHEITGVVRSTGWEIWVDGVLENSGAYSLGATGLATSAGLLVGQFGGTYTPMDIDHLAIWNSALPAVDITSNVVSCLTGNEANLTAYFPFNEGNGTTTTDFSATGINGTLTNMTVPADWISGSGLNCSGVCVNEMANQVTITVVSFPSQPTITYSGSNIICAGSTVTLNSSAGTSYLWSTGATTQSIVVSTAGTYNVQVANATGCQSVPSGSVVIQVVAAPAQPTVSAGGATTFCAGGSVTLTSSAGSSYLWSNGATTASINATTAGTYTVQVTNASGCQSTASAGTTVTVNAVPATPSISASGTTALCSGGSVTLTSTAGTSYLWSNGATSQSIVVSTAGTYSVQVTNAAGCLSAASAGTTVTVGTPPATPTITTGGPTTFCAGGSVTLTSSAGTSYLWSNGATTASISATTAGTYTVQVTNAAGCQSAASPGTTITVNALPSTPTINAGGPITFCAGGSVTLTSTAGTSYLWSNGATTASINATAAGTYTVQVTNAAGCQSVASPGTTVTVNALPTAPTITAGGSTTFCAGGSVTLTSTPGTSYLWSNGATTASINTTLAGTYTVQVTNAAGCQSAASAGTTVTVNALPTTPTISASGSTTFCAGGSVTLTSSASATYLWSNGATTASINATSAGTYTVQVTNAAGCQSATSVGTTVTVNSLPATPTITPNGPTTFCAGGSVTLSAPVSTSYLWSDGSMSQSINPGAGTYTVQVTNAAGCQSASSAPITVTVNALPNAPIISPNGPTTFCAGGTVNLASSAGISYLWSNGATTASIDVTASGTFTAQITGTNGCTSPISAPVTVTVNPNPTITLGTVSNPSSCTIGNGSIEVTGSGTGDLSWTGSSTGSSNGINLPTVINSLNDGSYQISFTNQNGCTSNMLSVSLTAPSAPAAPTITAGGATSFCDGGSVTLTSSTGTTYLWSNGATTPSINVTNAGNYTVSITDANGCSSLASASSVVTVLPLPVISSGTIVDPSSCIVSDGSIEVNGSGTGDLIWSGVSSGSQIGINLPATISGLGQGSYTLNFTDGNGCESSDLLVTLVAPGAPAAPSISANGPLTFCEGENVVLSSSIGDFYLWSNSETTQSITVNTSGTYSLTITDVNGCVSPSSNPVTVTVDPLPDLNISVNSNVLSVNQNGASYQWVDCNNGDAPIAGATNQTFTPSVNGSYACEITLGSCTSLTNCETISTIGLMENTKEMLAVFPNPATFTIQIQSSDVIENATIFDMRGNLVLQFTGNSTSIERLECGMYFISIKTEKGLYQSKFVKQ